jgi:hypothetical protein
MSFPAMKLIFTLLPAFAAMFSCHAADTDWRQAARDFLKEQQFAPIEIKPGARSAIDLAKVRWAWMQRVLLPVFEKNIAQWPQQAEAARSFVKQALLAKAGHPDVDPKRPWDVMAAEGTALAKAKVEEPLLLWLAAWVVWESNEGYTDAWDFLSRANRHKTLKDYPSVVAAYIEAQFNEIRRSSNSETIAKSNAERTKRMLKSAMDPAVFTPEEDELFFDEVEFVFTNANVKERQAELQKLCDAPHLTPWLREMLLGKLHNRIAWTHRGGGFANTVKDEGWKKFEEHQMTARGHFKKAWELRPDRPQGASSMIDIVKCGHGEPGETTRLWFDRAIAAQCDYYSAYYDLLWALRPRWGGSIDQMKAFYCACTLTGRHDQGVVVAMRRILEYLEDDVDDIRLTLSQEPLKQVVLGSNREIAESKEVYRLWQHDWRLADYGVLAWMAGDYETAYDTFQQVPVPFPRQTRRRLNLRANEAEVRAQSALYTFGFNTEWDAAEEAYTLGRANDALAGYQDIASRFQGEPPGLLLERIAACKFEKDFATGKWVKMWAFPDLAEWHHLSGFWTGLKTGTLVNNGHGARAFLLHNGRVGTNFEFTGEYEEKDLPDGKQGLSIILGYHGGEQTEDWISCAHWDSSGKGPVGSMLRKMYQTAAPQVTPPVNGRTWKFHIICRNGLVTYRLNHRDIVVNHRTTYKDGETFDMPENSVIGFFHHFFHEKSHTHIRRLMIRRLDPPDEKGDAKAVVASLADLRAGFAARCRRVTADLNAAALIEAEQLAEDRQRAKKTDEAAKVTAFAALLKSDAPVKFADMPVAAPGEDALATLLRGYHASLESRLAAARRDWKEKALELNESTMVAELETPLNNGVEEPLAAANALKWQKQSGEWQRTTELLAGNGDSTLLYDFNRSAPFQIDFEITVLDGMRPRLVMGNVKFANEAYKTTFGLYPQPKGAKLFTYERKKPYQITIKAAKDKTELLVDGVKVCDGPKVEGVLDVLQFRAGDDYSKGKAEFRKIRISPLP